MDDRDRQWGPRWLATGFVLGTVALAGAGWVLVSVGPRAGLVAPSPWYEHAGLMVVTGLLASVGGLLVV